MPSSFAPAAVTLASAWARLDASTMTRTLPPETARSLAPATPRAAAGPAVPTLATTAATCESALGFFSAAWLSAWLTTADSSASVMAMPCDVSTAAVDPVADAALATGADTGLREAHSRPRTATRVIGRRRMRIPSVLRGACVPAGVDGVPGDGSCSTVLTLRAVCSVSALPDLSPL